MVNPGFLRWALAIVLIVLILALIGAATVMMAGAVLQPQVVPTIKVQPEVVSPGDIVIVSGRGWPNLANMVAVVALSPTRDLATEGLLPVGAATVAYDGTLAAAFVFPGDVPWSALREAWVVVRPPAGNLQAVAHLRVQRLRPTATPSACPATTPFANRQQIQGTIVRLASDLGLLTLRPFDGSPDRGVRLGATVLRFADGRSASVRDLKAGTLIVAQGFFDASGTLVAEQIVILEVGQVLAPGILQVAPTACPVSAPTVCAPVCVVPTARPVAVPTVCAPVCLVSPTACPPPTPVPTCAPTVVIPPTACPPLTPGGTWRGEYFPNPWFFGPPVLVAEYRVIDFRWLDAPADGLPDFGYSVRWTGNMVFPATSRYRFLLLLKGNARLWVDGQCLIDQWNEPPPAQYVGEADLGAGPHALQLEYRNMGSEARIQLRWEYGGAVIPW